MTKPAIELVYFEGCPNVDQARTNLESALKDLGLRGTGGRAGAAWREWDLNRADTPDRYYRFGSPSILVDGRDVTGRSGPSEEGDRALSCRADGAPSPEAIREALMQDG